MNTCTLTTSFMFPHHIILLQMAESSNKCDHNRCYCFPNNQWYLAPWHTLQKIAEYHYDLSDEEAIEALEPAGDKGFILTNYNPYNPEGHFTVYTKYLLKDGVLIIKELKYRLILPRPPSWGPRNRLQFIFHGNLVDEFHNCHWDCWNSWRKKVPLVKNFVPSLKLLCRGAICSAFSFQQMEAARVHAELPQCLVDFVQERSTTEAPPREPKLFCDDYHENARTSNIKRSMTRMKPDVRMIFIVTKKNVKRSTCIQNLQI